MLKKGFLFFLFTFVCIGCFGDGGPLGVSVRSDSVSTGFGSYDKGTKKISVGFGKEARSLLGSENRNFVKNELGLDWYYAWNWERAKFMGNDTSVEFVPMFSGLVDYEERINIVTKKQPLPHFVLLGNEPWHHIGKLTISEEEEDKERARVTKIQLDTLEKLVKEFPDSNVVKIGTPGIAWTLYSRNALKEFMVGVNGDPDKYRIDFTAYHNYASTHNSLISSIITMSNDIKYQGRDLKVWITEYGALYYGFRDYTLVEKQQNKDDTINIFLPETMYRLNTDDRIERYTWFSGLSIDNTSVLAIFSNSSPVGGNLNLTRLGKVYTKYIKNPPMTKPTRAEIQPGGRYGPD